jgi:glycerol-3-phosphate dehydrogenase (NAD(P)+)
VLLFSRRGEQAALLSTERTNQRYLPGINFPPALKVSASLEEAVTFAADGLLIAATPVAGLRPLLIDLRAIAPPTTLPPLLWLCKGFEQGTQQLPHQIVEQEWGAAASMRSGVLSGPSFAIEVAQGLPSALTVAGAAAFCAQVTHALHGGVVRIYAADDVVGVEVGGAVKNVLAIATGIADALGLGANARAALITRGLAEITRLGLALGGQPATFTGLSGLGDLILTCTGELSRNRKVGLALGQGAPLAAVLAQLGHVAEGVYCAPAILARAREHAVEMPITAAVCAVLEGRCTAQSALHELLAREPRREYLSID